MSHQEDPHVGDPQTTDATDDYLREPLSTESHFPSPWVGEGK